MPVGTIMIHGSDGEVMVPFGNGEFRRGKRMEVKLVKRSDDSDLPIRVRKALVGLTVSTIFSSRQVGGAAPPGSRVAYASEVAEALTAARKKAVAQELLAACKAFDPSAQYHFLVFKKGEYKIVK